MSGVLVEAQLLLLLGTADGLLAVLASRISRLILFSCVSANCVKVVISKETKKINLCACWLWLDTHGFRVLVGFAVEARVRSSEA